MNRFYTPQTDFSSPSVIITDPKECHHLRDVLRLGSGDRIQLFNGEGMSADGVIGTVQKSAVTVLIKKVYATVRPYLSRLILACALPKKGKFETIIEKTTELGVDEIIPMVTARTECRYDHKRAEKKHIRFSAVAKNAAKQCRRPDLPRIHPITPFSAVLDHFIDGQTNVLIPWLEGERRDLHSVLSGSSRPKKLILIGPEGDFTPEEADEAIQRGAQPVSLGPLVLRVETAAIAVTAVSRLTADIADHAQTRGAHGET